eukprot:6326308-Lingulodinium_polyedra.AAC.1
MAGVHPPSPTMAPVVLAATAAAADEDSASSGLETDGRVITGLELEWAQHPPSRSRRGRRGKVARCSRDDSGSDSTGAQGFLDPAPSTLPGLMCWAD